MTSARVKKMFSGPRALDAQTGREPDAFFGCFIVEPKEQCSRPAFHMPSRRARRRLCVAGAFSAGAHRCDGRIAS